MEQFIAFSLRIPKKLAAAIEVAAKRMGLSKSEYARLAFEELNHRVMQDRIAELSRQLASQSAVEAEAMDVSSADGFE